MKFTRTLLKMNKSIIISIPHEIVKKMNLKPKQIHSFDIEEPEVKKVTSKVKTSKQGASISRRTKRGK